MYAKCLVTATFQCQFTPPHCFIKWMKLTVAPAGQVLCPNLKLFLNRDGNLTGSRDISRSPMIKRGRMVGTAFMCLIGKLISNLMSFTGSLYQALKLSRQGDGCLTGEWKGMLLQLPQTECITNKHMFPGTEWGILYGEELGRLSHEADSNFSHRR